ncbi:site-specific DNA-methyltransferase [Devosia alba]|uniref:site-specific DNA-methyltransferase n=1 Tax=Devosia alba TaxID=3152360 RepID=UPI003263F7F6
MSRKTKLELTWVGKENRPRLEPRVLIDVPELSHTGEVGIMDNLLVQGDNLLALKALESEYAGRVKCVFIDPPYNTGSAFEHYDDGLEHSIWLSMMRDRLEVIRNLLSPDGSLWVTLDDNEAHYFKVMADEVFGRGNFVANVVWQKRTSPEARLRLGAAHDSVLVIAKDISKVELNLLPVSEETKTKATNKDDDYRGPWSSSDFTAQGWRPNQMYKITTPGGAVYEPPPGRCWGNIEPEYRKLLADNRLWFGVDGKARPRVKTFLLESEGRASWTWWPNSEVGHNQEAKKEQIELSGEESTFDTPKPERLLQRIVTLATNPGDLVLDSFAGSGTTGAVAHKMGRRWIMVEIGDHAQTHIVPRLRKVIDGLDAGGVTAATNWQGGGGFRFCRLAPSLITRDKWGREVISAAYDGPLLAQALCKIKGFRYSPSETDWWVQGKSSDTDFLHVTTQTLSFDQLAELSELVGEGRTLLILCAAWRGDEKGFPNLTVSKIPDDVLKQCDFGREDYGLPITGDAQ